MTITDFILHVTIKCCRAKRASLDFVIKLHSFRMKEQLKIYQYFLHVHIGQCFFYMRAEQRRETKREPRIYTKIIRRKKRSEKEVFKACSWITQQTVRPTQLRTRRVENCYMNSKLSTNVACNFSLIHRSRTTEQRVVMSTGFDKNRKTHWVIRDIFKRMTYKFFPFI